MKRIVLVLLVTLGVGVTLGFVPTQFMHSLVVTVPAQMDLDDSELASADLAALTTGMDTPTKNTWLMVYIQRAADRQSTLLRLYMTGTITLQGYTFTATAETISNIKTEFAALRTRIIQAENGISAQ